MAYMRHDFCLPGWFYGIGTGIEPSGAGVRVSGKETSWIRIRSEIQCSAC